MMDKLPWMARIKHPHASWVVTGLVLFLAAGWLAAHPYMGLWHDTRLYAVDALARLSPEVYARDLFLEFGSQGEFTLFPALFVALISWLGLDDAALVLALVGKLLWLLSLILLARRVELSRAWAFGLLLVLAYPPYYDSHKIFSYGESFATPRIYAEAISMLALAAWLRSRSALALILVVLAGLLHPLMAIPVASLLGLLTYAAYRHLARGKELVVVGAVVIGLALLWIPELGERTLSTYDNAWLEAVRLRNPYVFLDQWDDMAFGRMVWVGVVLALCVVRMQAVMARTAGAVLGVMISLLVLAWLGASVWGNVLLTQLQLWRVMWLAQLLALLLVGGLLPRLWRSDYPDKVLAASLAAALLADGWSSGFMAVAGVALEQMFRRMGTKIDTALFPWKALPLLLVLPGTISHLLQLPYWFLANEVFLGKPLWRTLIGDGVVGLALATVFYWTLRQGSMRTAKWLAGLGMTAMLSGVVVWTSYDMNPMRTSLRPVYAQLRDHIPPGSVVAAPVAGAPELVWFDLGRASYVSQLQTAGSLFSRDTALEGLKRLELMQAAGFPYSSLAWDDADQTQSTLISVQSVMQLCGDDNLDFVLMSGPRDGAVQYSRLDRVVFSLYECEALRQQDTLPKIWLE